MAASSTVTGRVSPPRVPSPRETKFDRRLAKILRHATEVFYEKGYEGASLRDLSRASGMSLAGMYYYFESKEKLLYLIQKHTFRTIVDRLRERLEGVSDPEQRIRALILNHLEYFLDHQKAMKVLSHEDEKLTNSYGAEVRAIKREYVGICLELMDAFQKARGIQFSSRTAVLSLFGMMNWIYTWYKPRVDGGAEQLATVMGDIFLRGVSASGRKSAAKKKSVN
jgi:TetR/AcrR family transcriptional regulator, cholesterol catabolism regulator